MLLPTVLLPRYRSGDSHRFSEDSQTTLSFVDMLVDIDIRTLMSLNCFSSLTSMFRQITVHGCVLLLNVIGGFVLMLRNGEFSTFGLEILYLILFTPFSFLCWFRPAYRAFKYVFISIFIF